MVSEGVCGNGYDKINVGGSQAGNQSWIFKSTSAATANVNNRSPIRFFIFKRYLFDKKNPHAQTYIFYWLTSARFILNP